MKHLFSSPLAVICISVVLIILRHGNIRMHKQHDVLAFDCTQIGKMVCTIFSRVIVCKKENKREQIAQRTFMSKRMEAMIQRYTWI